MNDKVTQEEIEQIFSELKKNPLNNKCMDCQSRNPKWASASLGIFLCMDCAGQHRNIGVQYTFVRSLNLDTWTRKQITCMIKGGNEKAYNYFKKNGLEIKNISDYTTAISLRYKEELNKIVEKEFKEQQQDQQIIQPSSPATQQQQQQKQLQQQQNSQKIHPKETPFQNNLKPTSTVAYPSQLPLQQTNKGKMHSLIQPKGKVAGKKLGDFDFGALSLADKEKAITPSDSKPYQEQKIIRKTSSSLELSNQDSNVKSISSKNQQNNYYTEETKEQYSKFNGQTSLSSAQLFGQQLESSESNQEGYSLGQYIQMDSILDYASNNIQKLKESAGNAVERLKQWKNQA